MQAKQNCCTKRKKIGWRGKYAPVKAEVQKSRKKNNELKE
jgi:hypothetical protein